MDDLARRPGARTILLPGEAVVKGAIILKRSVTETEGAASLNLPRFRGHPRSHESAVGVVHGQAQAAGVHEGV
jgi:hypothetical protein